MRTPAPTIDVMIQARMGSTRLPGKVLLPLGDTTALGMMLTRVRRATRPRHLVVLTTRLGEDDELADAARRHGAFVFRGTVDDVLGRYAEAACQYGSDAVVRLTGDCPFADPGMIDEMCRVFQDGWPRLDFVTNCLRRTYPRGLDVEILSRRVLETLHTRCREEYYREHVVPYVEEHPDEFRVAEHLNAVDESEYRLTLDTRADYDTIVNVYGLFGHDRFLYRELIGAVREHPHLLVNAAVAHKAYRTSSEVCE